MAKGSTSAIVRSTGSASASSPLVGLRATWSATRVTDLATESLLPSADVPVTRMVCLPGPLAGTSTEASKEPPGPATVWPTTTGRGASKTIFTGVPARKPAPDRSSNWPDLALLGDWTAGVATMAGGGALRVTRGSLSPFVVVVVGPGAVLELRGGVVAAVDGARSTPGPGAGWAVLGTGPGSEPVPAGPRTGSVVVGTVVADVVVVIGAWPCTVPWGGVLGTVVVLAGTVEVVVAAPVLGGGPVTLGAVTSGVVPPVVAGTVVVVVAPKGLGTVVPVVVAVPPVERVVVPVVLLVVDGPVPVPGGPVVVGRVVPVVGAPVVVGSVVVGSVVVGSVVVVGLGGTVVLVDVPTVEVVVLVDVPAVEVVVLAAVLVVDVVLLVLEVGAGFEVVVAPPVVEVLAAVPVVVVVTRGEAGPRPLARVVTVELVVAWAAGEVISTRTDHAARAYTEPIVRRGRRLPGLAGAGRTAVRGVDIRAPTFCSGAGEAPARRPVHDHIPRVGRPPGCSSLTRPGGGCPWTLRCAWSWAASCSWSR